MIDKLADLNLGFADFLCSLLVSSGYLEKDARDKVKISEDYSSLSSTLNRVHFMISFYKNGTGSRRVSISLEGDEEKASRIDRVLGELKSISQLRREAGNLVDRSVNYDSMSKEVVIGCRLKRSPEHIAAESLYTDVWGYLLKPAIRVLST